MVQPEERGAVCDQVRLRFTDYLERADELRQEVRSAMVYPAILLLTSFASVTVLLTYVLPKFAAIFTHSKQVMPFSTRLLMGSSDMLRS
jgi:general secretion pathway protein F